MIGRERRSEASKPPLLKGVSAYCFGNFKNSNKRVGSTEADYHPKPKEVTKKEMFMLRRSVQRAGA